MRGRALRIGYRIFFALLGFSALVTEIATITERGKFVPSNFFSYFTIESNLFAVAVLLLAAFALAGGSQNSVVSMLRGASTLYIAVVGLVFPLLLAGLDAEFTAVPWDNIVLHYLMPLALVMDWFLDLPTQRIPFRQALVWLGFPVAYVTYSLVRGILVGWYPYPFLDPDNHGYTGVVITSIGIAVGAAALTWLLVTSTGRQEVAHPTRQRTGSASH